MAQLAIEDLSYTYPNATASALTDIRLSVGQGEFVTLMGATGSGKSTLLRLLKPELRQNGTVTGRVTLDGEDILSLSARRSAEKIGYVAQEPQEQIVTDKVWHELAFTLESLGAKRGEIARRVAEIAAYFDIDGWLGRDTATLSGGEMQLLNLAAVMTADPEVLLLDEPTAQLDPIAAARFIDTLYRLNRETGVTVLLCEHRAEELFGISDRVILLDRGKVMCDDTPSQTARMIGGDSPFTAYLPSAARLYHAVRGEGTIPLTVRAGQRFVEGYDNRIRCLDKEEYHEKKQEALSLKGVYFRYERHGGDILRDLDMTIGEGEVFAVLGANGAGKSTAAAVAAGLTKPCSGTVKLFGKPLKDYKNGALYRGNISLLPQDTQSVFLYETVERELQGCEQAVSRLPYDLRPLYSRHPYDISGGERQLVALCKALATQPRLLIMDEPSKGLDANAKSLLCRVIGQLKGEGVTVMLITHDAEFAADCADRCALFSQGRIAAVEPTQAFMSGNLFYTTAASRMTRHRYDGAYTVARAAELITRNGGAS